MLRVFEINYEDIHRLNAIQLTELLKKLLHLEANKFEIPQPSISVSLKINSSDGGQDGRINWVNSLEYTDYIPNRDVIFQCKQRNTASDFARAQCIKELTEKINGKSKVKPIINNLFVNGGQYILFCNFSCNSRMKTSRIEGFHEGLRKAGAFYSENAKIDIYDSEKIADWVNCYIQAIIWVNEQTGKHIPSSARSWEQWSKDFNNKFYTNEKANGKIKLIKNHLSEKKKAARIVGNSGLGKSRLACEVFRPQSDPETDYQNYELSAKVVYLDAQDCPEIVTTVAHWIQNKKSGIIVVDECDCSLHYRLLSQIKREDSNFSLLTIDFSEACGDMENPTIFLEPVPDEVIQRIIQDAYPNLPEKDVQRIVEITKGYPKMAVMIAANRAAGLDNAAEITNREFINRLIWGRIQPDQEQEKVLCGCSIFTMFGYKEDISSHRNFIAETICEMNPDDFFRIVEDVKSTRRIIEERNRYYRVVPPPLAITLAARWWSGCSPEKAERILTGDIPEGLINPLCDQFRFLNLEPRILELTTYLCGPQGPFGRAEILNSYRGSRIFRSITEVNPSVSIETLERIYRDFDKEDLKKVDLGRRNLIWALENLIFWEETFLKAARLLLRFAVAETEGGIANNATGQFYQVFHYLLSGTQAPLEKRLKIIDEGLSTGDIDYQKICIEALGHALWTWHFSRTGSVETQGSRYPHEDWQPTKWQEVFDYWEAALIRLTKYALKDGELGSQAKSIIEKSIPGLLRYGRLDAIETAILALQGKYGKFLPEILYEIKEFLHTYSEKIPKEGRIRMERWIDSLSPHNFKENYYITVIRPEVWVIHESDEWYKLHKERIDSFSLEISRDVTALYDNIDILYRGESVGGFEFGCGLGKYLTKRKIFIQKSLGILRKIDKSERNVSVLSGFLSTIRKDYSTLVSYCLDTIGSDADLRPFLLQIIAQIKPQEKDLSRLIYLVEEGQIEISQFRILQYGNVLSDFKPKEILRFLGRLAELDEDSAPILMGIIYMYTLKNKEKFDACIPFIRKLILEGTLISKLTTKKLAHHEAYEISESIIALLRREDPDIEILEKICREVLRICDINPVKSVELSFIFHEMIAELFSERYVEYAWDIFASEIIEKNARQYYCIKDLIGKKANFSEGLIHNVPIQVLEKWCKKSKDIAPFLAKTMTPIVKDENQINWSKIALFLFDNYGNNPKILRNIDVNLGNYSITGSALPYLEAIYLAFQQITDHQNPIVKKWAIRNCSHYKFRIDKCKKYEEEERELGVIVPPFF